MNAHQGPLSPVSVASSEWSGITRYGTNERNYSPTVNSNNYNSRSNLATPPVSGSSHNLNGNLPNGMNGGMSGRPGDYRNNPSPPSSIARSSNGTTMSMEGQRKKQSMMEDSLAQHYIELKAFLDATLREEKSAGKPNRARDKLLRLSAVQFQELSTDVYDELLRRKTYDRIPPHEREKRPGFLLPKENFHPKRNQARQKLSTLPLARFTALATDVFFELERRFPRFAAGDISRHDSPANSMRGPPSRGETPNGVRGESSERGGPRRPGQSRQGSLGGQVLAGLGIPGIGSQDDYNRPTPKSSQSNTIVPNKSYLVEDDDDQEYTDDTYGMNRRDTSNTSRSAESMERDKKMLADYESQVNELQGKVAVLQSQVRLKDETINGLESSKRDIENDVEKASTEWSQLQRDLEGKLEDALKLNDNLQVEIEKVKSYHADTEKNLRSQLDQMTKQGNGNNEWKRRCEDLQQENEEYRREIHDQQKVADEVRQEAFAYLTEMKAISDRSGQNWEREEQLVQQVQRLEEEVKDWKSRYARTKTQLRTLRTSSMGLAAMQQPNAGQLAKDGGLIRQEGLVRDVHVTKFQIAIDEVLRVARMGDTQAIMQSMKSVVMAVRSICQEIPDTVSPDDECGQQGIKLRANVSTTANNFITASKNFASSNGLSPVSLLDAAASHLAAAVVELIRTVKIRPTPADDVEDDEEGDLVQGMTRNYNSANRRSSITESVYSRASAQQTRPPSTTNHARQPSRNQNTDYSSARRPPSRNGVSMTKSSDVIPRPGYAKVANVRDNEIEDLKLLLEDQTESLVQSIQSLVSSIRTVDEPEVVHEHISSMASIVGHVVKETQRVIDKTGNTLLRDQAAPIVRTLAGCKAKLLAADDDGSGIQNHAEWKEHINTLPPIAFEIARETKELVQRINRVGEAGRNSEDFS